MILHLLVQMYIHVYCRNIVLTIVDTNVYTFVLSQFNDTNILTIVITNVYTFVLYKSNLTIVCTYVSTLVRYE